MAEQLNLSINVTGNAVESIGSVKKELKEANQELIKAQSNFGEYSNEALNAAKKVAQLKDRIQEARETADLFDPGKKFQALSNTLSTVAGGFSAVQGAIGLFGNESKELEKQLLKVQSALALSQGLSTIADGAKDFQRLATIVKTQVVTAFSTLRGALIATGIGALAIGVGLLAANFDKVKTAILNLIPGLGTFAKFVGDSITKLTDFVGITSEADRTLKSLGKTTERANEGIDARIKLLTAQGGKEAEIYKLQKQRNENDLNSLREKLKLTGKLSEEEQKRFRELKNDNAVLDAQENTRLIKAEEERKKKAAIETPEQKLKREIKEAEADIKAAKIREQKIQNNLATVQKEGLEKRKTDAILNTQVTNQQVQVLNAQTQEQIQRTAEQADLRAYENKRARLAAETELASQTLGVLAGIVDQNSAAGKAIAVSQAIINTYQAASKAFAQGGILGPVLGATTIAAGLINVKKIISTKVPSAKGSGFVGDKGGPSISGGGSTSPITPTAPEPQLTQLNQSSINAIGNQSIKAYVVETDISSSQQRIKAIEQRARFN